MVTTTIQVSQKLRRRLVRLKDDPRQTYESVIDRALDASERDPARPLEALDARADDTLRVFSAAMRRLYGDRLVRMVLYGSVARGDAGPHSDVDVLVVLRDPVVVAREIDRIVGVTYDLLLAGGPHVSALPMGEREFLTRASPLLMNVRREGVPL